MGDPYTTTGNLIGIPFETESSVFFHWRNSFGFPYSGWGKKIVGNRRSRERENERAVLMNEQSALLPNESRLRNACASFYGGSITLAAAYLERIFWLSRCRTCRRSLLLASPLLFYKTITKCETQL